MRRIKTRAVLPHRRDFRIVRGISAASFSGVILSAGGASPSESKDLLSFRRSPSARFLTRHLDREQNPAVPTALGLILSAPSTPPAGGGLRTGLDYCAPMALGSGTWARHRETHYSSRPVLHAAEVASRRQVLLQPLLDANSAGQYSRILGDRAAWKLWSARASCTTPS